MISLFDDELLFGEGRPTTSSLSFSVFKNSFSSLRTVKLTLFFSLMNCFSPLSLYYSQRWMRGGRSPWPCLAHSYLVTIIYMNFTAIDEASLAEEPLPLFQLLLQVFFVAIRGRQGGKERGALSLSGQYNLSYRSREGAETSSSQECINRSTEQHLWEGKGWWVNEGGSQLTQVSMPATSWRAIRGF